MSLITTALAAYISLGACSMPVGANESESSYAADLIKVGANVPNANVTIPGGKTVKLYSLLAGKKAAIINFWFYH